MPVIAIVWRFRAAEGQSERFEEAYGPGGGWAQLFAQAAGHVRTELLRASGGDYITIDYWRDEAAWQAFLRDHRPAYDAFDKQCETLTAEEVKIGVFTVVES